jgi:hypothetical protein
VTQIVITNRRSSYVKAGGFPLVAWRHRLKEDGDE